MPVSACFGRCCEIMRDSDIHRVMAILAKEVGRLGVPVVTEIAGGRKRPFEVLIATLLSLRTKDEVTRAASARLFQKVSTPRDMLKLSEEEIRALIYPVGFYKRKARVLREVCATLIERFGGRVPDDLDTLLELKGVGRKTANLVVTLGFGKQGICVDTHVHRVSNRLGYVRTKTPEETEQALRRKLPPRYWIRFNDYLVAHGQNVCKPVSPLCSRCPLRSYCGKVGVTRHR
jgi:endonuclease-3